MTDNSDDNQKSKRRKKKLSEITLISQKADPFARCSPMHV